MEILILLFHIGTFTKNQYQLKKECGGREIRTPEGLCHWILSPAPIIGLDPSKPKDL